MSFSGEVPAPIERRFVRAGRKLVVDLSAVALAGACSVGGGNGNADPSASPVTAVDASLCGPLESYHIIANNRIDGLHVANMGKCVNVYNDDAAATSRLVGQVAGLDRGGGFVIDCVETGSTTVLWVDVYGNEGYRGYIELAPSAVRQLGYYQNTPVRVPNCPPLVNA